MQHRLHWGRSEDTTFPRLCQPGSKVPHPTMGDTRNHAPTTHVTHQATFLIASIHKRGLKLGRHGLGLACNCATDPPKQRRRCWSKALRSKDPASLPMCTTSRQTRRDGLDRLLRTRLTANDKLFKKTVQENCACLLLKKSIPVLVIQKLIFTLPRPHVFQSHPLSKTLISFVGIIG